MGLSTATDNFQHKMSKLMQDLEFVRVYLDDLLVVSNGGFQNHISKLRQVLTKLREANLKINAPKCSFAVKEIEYLGYTLTTNGIKPSLKKIEAIKKLKAPTTIKQLKSFLGMVTYYRDTWQKRSHILAPLTDLLRKNEKSKRKLLWTTEHEQAFISAKEAISNDVLLTHPDFTKKFTIHTDASDTQLGSIISQDGKPIAFYSRKLSSTQRNYSVGEREMLSIVETLKEFRPILCGHEIEIFTDHINLTKPETQHASSRIQRWRWLIEEFGPTLIYLKGDLNKAADAMSRLEIDNTDLKPSSNPIRHAMPNNHEIFFTARCLSTVDHNAFYQSEDKIRNESFMTTLYHEAANEAFESSVTENAEKAFPMGPKHIVQNQKNDETLKMLLQRDPNQFSHDHHGQILFKNKVYVPKSVSNDIIQWYHTMLCHPGEQRLLQTLKQNFIWPKMQSHIHEFTKSCDVCQKRKSNRKSYGKLPISDIHITPWKTVCVDLIGPYSLTDGSGKEYKLHAMTMADPATGWFEIAEISDKTAEIAALTLDRVWFSRYPRPFQSIYDNGGEFLGKEFQELLESYGVKTTPTTEKNPQANFVERVHLTLGNMLRTHEMDKSILDPNDPFTGIIQHCAWAIRTTVNIITGYSPAQLIFGRDMIHDVSFIIDWNKIKQRKIQNKIANNTIENKKRSEHSYKVGDKILLEEPNVLQRKLHRQRKGPFKITKIYTHGIVKITKGIVSQKVSIRRIKPFFERK